MKFLDLSKYSYLLPSALIAQRPCSPKDKAKLLVYSRDANKYVESTFLELGEFLDSNCLLVFNDTKVIPARIYGKRKTGARIEVFFIKNVSNDLEGKTSEWQVMLSKGLRLNEKILLPGNLVLEITKQNGKYFTVKVKLNFTNLLNYLDQFGKMPIPPYIDNPDNEDKLRKEYQTIFAKELGSVAAPTASLHFSKRLLNKLKVKRIDYCFLTLHVGLGTFSPLTEKNFKSNKLHEEYFEIDSRVFKKIKDAKKNGKKIIAVGTTSLRTLETICKQKIFERDVVKVKKIAGQTNLFITPPYKFKIVDGLITNFHLPCSSLLLLVSSFINDRKKTLDLYKFAVSQKYRFFSFGDGMLII